MTHHEHPNVSIVKEGFEALQRGDTAWMDQHLADDVVWHVGGNSKWAGAYRGKAKVLEYFARQAQATDGRTLLICASPDFDPGARGALQHEFALPGKFGADLGLDVHAAASLSSNARLRSTPQR